MRDNIKKHLILSIPYLIVWYLADKLGWLYRVAEGTLAGEKLLFVFSNFQAAFHNPLPSFHPHDFLVGVAGALIARGLIYMKQQDAKKFRQGVEYGSARWSA